jgi:hypothetical protein
LVLLKLVPELARYDAVHGGDERKRD